MDFISKVNKGQAEYGGIPFWSWNDKLNPEELRRQINVMNDLGMHGYFMHARGGLETEYLSRDWFDCVRACVDEGKKLGMESWSYDENGWPSGFGGGKVLEDPANFATYLKLEEFDAFPELGGINPPDNRVLSVYVPEGDSFRRITAPVEGFDGKYLAVVQHYDSSYVDVLDKDVIRRFIDCTHEEYKKEMGEDFGKAMPGFFTDEPQYYRYATPWSNKMPERFSEKYGYDVYENLLALFKDYPGADEFRYDYWYLCHTLFMNAFAKQIYDWCEENGAKLTGHAVEESTLFTQMWCCGGVMPFYEFEHMPGMDYLGRGIASDLAPKQLGSVTAQLGKKKTLTETFACCGWDVTPRELKKIADLQYASGVNVMCQHLYAYSIRGQRKRDYPANYSEHLPWQDAFGDFVKYYNRLGFTLSMGKEAVKTLIVHPIHSDYLTYKREIDGASVAKIEEGVNAILTYFGDRQLSYHFGDETLMAKYAKAENGKLTVGEMTYEYVVLPRIFTLDGSTAALLKEYLAQGGKLALFDGAPDRIDGRKADMSWLKATCTMEEIEKDTFVKVRGKDKELLPGVKAMCRDTEFGRICFVTNVSGNDYENATVCVKGVKELYEVNLEQGDWTKGNPVRKCEFTECCCGGGIKIATSFETGKSRLFVERTDDTVLPAEKDGLYAKHLEGVKLPKICKLSEKPENALTLDYATVSTDGGRTFGASKPIIQIFDELLRARFKGELVMRYGFHVTEIPASLKVAMEPMRFSSVKINGKDAAFTGDWWLDRSFRVCDVMPYVQTGDNVIEVAFDYFQDDYVYYVLYGNVMESLRNCLVFNTEVEAMYLFGDFSVITDKNAFTPAERLSDIYTGTFSLAKSKDTVDVSNVVEDGYPFFAGKLVFEQKFVPDADNTKELWLDGRFSYADVWVNGAFVKRLMFTNHCDISAFVKEGENTVKVLLANSNRNLLGPHHFADPEPYALGPSTFSLENMWHDGKCDLFRERYSFVRFGAEISVR